MAYSDTINETQITVGQLIEYAFRAAGKTAEEQTPEYIQAAKQALYYILQDLPNKGVNLWMLKEVLIGTTNGQKVVDLPASTIGIRAANWSYQVTPQIAEALPLANSDAAILFDGNLQGFATSISGANNWFGASYSTAQTIVNVGFNAYAAGGGSATYNLILEASNDAATWSTVETLPTTTIQDGTWAYYPINTTVPYLYYRLRETVASTFSLRQITFNYVQQVIPMAPLNRDDYFSLPQQAFASNRALQYWFDKKIDPQIRIWPVPNNDFQMMQFVLELQPWDVGNLSNQLYVPNRWIRALQSMLSHELALQIPGVDLNKVQYLEGQAAKHLLSAENGEEDEAPIFFRPNISYYTR
jgi:hypothetical protein